MGKDIDIFLKVLHGYICNSKAFIMTTKKIYNLFKALVK